MFPIVLRRFRLLPFGLAFLAVALLASVACGSAAEPKTVEVIKEVIKFIGGEYQATPPETLPEVLVRFLTFEPSAFIT